MTLASVQKQSNVKRRLLLGGRRPALVVFQLSMADENLSQAFDSLFDPGGGNA
jgi:hypothetical protein